MRPSEVLASLLLVSTACASKAGWAPIEALNGMNDIDALFPRQENNDNNDNNDNGGRTSFDLSFSATQGNTATTEPTGTRSGDESATTTGGDSKTTGDSNDDDEKETGTNPGKETGTGTKKGGSSTKTFDARLPAGGVSMITPNPMTTQYYKIKDYITFAWNYTSLSVTPSAIDVLASCSKNQQTYTLAMNLTVEETQSFTWDTGAFQASATVPLLTETYTLIIHDAAKDVTDRAQAGYLGTYDQFTFGMYSPQPYTPMADYVCATCNGASSLEKQTWIALLGMVGVTVVTFGWFTGLAGLW
ncbi:hypothetical protein CB0940_06076 [Cercospora beticola]|uniref:DUF7137 domain-containing protein n=1 Tax=Cercospora beticola TaxID=122368 RepID=A0A2G5I0V6_CERBT|nr:hypothetical protein CB0940_06076 [Cercospora beticola]PIA98398.1 hypothetical protein CB0940_06076 [Cercospora beticola]WPA98690.1 hypothetical protein RHO25_003303 [Cercospora beticola]CAK1359958.1 unnamed protein product [Cercospora beticola]